jgi:ABC-type bacteriocin/lantibiotic exporter with double-glycine peptidase domain
MHSIWCSGCLDSVWNDLIVKEKILEIFERFEKIGLQAKAWKFYGIITPSFFVIVFLSFHFMTNQTLNLIILGWVLFILSCLVWWFWTIRIFQSLMTSNKELYSMIKSVAEDVIEVKKNVHSLSKVADKNVRQSK